MQAPHKAANTALLREPAVRLGFSVTLTLPYPSPSLMRRAALVLRAAPRRSTQRWTFPQRCGQPDLLVFGQPAPRPATSPWSLSSQPEWGVSLQVTHSDTAIGISFEFQLVLAAGTPDSHSLLWIAVQLHALLPWMRSAGNAA